MLVKKYVSWKLVVCPESIELKGKLVGKEKRKWNYKEMLNSLESAT
jgi:hypothetical protein